MGSFLFFSLISNFHFSSIQLILQDQFTLPTTNMHACFTFQKESWNGNFHAVYINHVWFYTWRRELLLAPVLPIEFFRLFKEYICERVAKSKFCYTILIYPHFVRKEKSKRKEKKKKFLDLSIHSPPPVSEQYQNLGKQIRSMLLCIIEQRFSFFAKKIKFHLDYFKLNPYLHIISSRHHPTPSHSFSFVLLTNKQSRVKYFQMPFANKTSLNSMQHVYKFSAMCINSSVKYAPNNMLC